MFTEIPPVLSSNPRKETGANPDIDRNGRTVAAQEIETGIVSANVSVSVTRTETKTGTKIATEIGIETEIAVIGIGIGIEIVGETPIERGIITDQEIVETHTHAPIETAMKEADLGQGLNG